MSPNLLFSIPIKTCALIESSFQWAFRCLEHRNKPEAAQHKRGTHASSDADLAMTKGTTNGKPSPREGAMATNQRREAGA